MQVSPVAVFRVYRPRSDRAWQGNGSERQLLQGASIHSGSNSVGRSLVSDVPGQFRDLELMLIDRGVDVDHTTIFRWIRAYAEELEKRVRPHLRISNGSWRVDETYVRVKGHWTYLYRAVDSRGQTIDFLVSARRDAVAAKRFFRRALVQPHVVNPRTLTVDKNPAYPRAVVDMKRDGELTSRTRMRQCKYLNNIVEQDHRRIAWLAGARLRLLSNGAENLGRLRGLRDDPEGPDSKPRRARHQGSGCFCRQPLRDCRVAGRGHDKIGATAYASLDKKGTGRRSTYLVRFGSCLGYAFEQRCG